MGGQNGGRRPRKGRAGYTLVELMITLGIIGILSGLASIESARFVARSKRSEAYITLEHIYKNEAVNLGQYGVYLGTFDEMGFNLDGGRRIASNVIVGRYYTFVLSQPWGPASFYLSATANIDDDPWPDVLVMVEGAPSN